MKRRYWVRSGISEEFDLRQQRLLKKVLEAVHYYYAELYQTKACYDQPLSLSMLMKLTGCSGVAVLSAVRVLANSHEEGQGIPPLVYDRVTSGRNACHRPFRIFLRDP